MHDIVYTNKIDIAKMKKDAQERVRKCFTTDVFAGKLD